MPPSPKDEEALKSIPRMGFPMAETVARPKPPISPELQGDPCDVCGSPTIEIRCKVICRKCGYVRDCSDP